MLMALKKGLFAGGVLGVITLCLLFFAKAMGSFPSRGELPTVHILPMATHRKLNPGSREAPQDRDPEIRNTLDNSMPTHRIHYDFHHDLDHILFRNDHHLHAMDSEIDNVNIFPDEEMFLGHMQDGCHLHQDRDNNFDSMMSNEDCEIDNANIMPDEDYEIDNVNIMPDEETFLGHMQDDHLHHDHDNNVDSIMSNEQFILDRMRDDPLYEPGEELMIINHHIQEHKYIKSHLSASSHFLVAAS